MISISMKFNFNFFLAFRWVNKIINEILFFLSRLMQNWSNIRKRICLGTISLQISWQHFYHDFNWFKFCNFVQRIYSLSFLIKNSWYVKKMYKKRQSLLLDAFWKFKNGQLFEPSAIILYKLFSPFLQKFYFKKPLAIQLCCYIYLWQFPSWFALHIFVHNTLNIIHCFHTGSIFFQLCILYSLLRNFDASTLIEIERCFPSIKWTLPYIRNIKFSCSLIVKIITENRIQHKKHIFFSDYHIWNETPHTSSHTKNIIPIYT